MLKKLRSKLIRINEYQDNIIIRSLLGKKIISKKHINILDYSILSRDYDNGKISTKIQIPKTINKYKTKVSVQGFVSSGSTVITDLLREFDNTTSICAYELETDNVKDIKEPPIELDFYIRLKLYNLPNILNMDEFEADKYIKQMLWKSRKYLGDLKLQSIITCDPVFEFNKLILSLFNIQGGGKIIDMSLPLPITMYSMYDNNYIKSKDNDCIYYKVNTDLTQEDIKLKVRNFVDTIFNSINSKEILVTDQFLKNFEDGYDLDFHQQFVGKTKQIVVYRDLRDQFMVNWLHTFFLFDEYSYIMKDNFSFLNNVLSKYKQPHQDRLFISFESLVNDYENSVDKICNFLDIDKSHHINKFKHFKPEVSRKNIGIYKNFHDQKIMQQIYENFKEYCYEK